MTAPHDHRTDRATGKAGRAPVLFCTVCDDRFALSGAVLLRSLMDRFEGFGRHRVKVFFDDAIYPLSPDSRSMIRDVAPHVEFEPIENEVYRRASVKTEAHRSAYLTLELFRQWDADRVIFLDADMLCLRDFSEVLDDRAGFIACRSGRGCETMEDRTVRWGGDQWPSRDPLSRLRAGLRRASGRAPAPPVMVNTGFMVVSGTYLAPGAYEGLLDFVRRREGQSHMLDQVVINTYFGRRGDRVRLVPQLYNFRDWGVNSGSDELFERLDDRIRLVHYSGYDERPKPWDPRASDRLTAVRIWRQYAREQFGSGFLTAIRESPEAEIQ